MKHLQRKIFKISTSRFRKAKWDLTLSYAKAIQLDEIISLFDSQMFRLIEQIRGGPINSEKEVLSVVIENKKDFIRATSNKGIKLNGITYKRFVGTTGGLKNKTLLFVNAEIINELNKRCECGRDQEIPLVPAKYEAYKALTASASTQIVNPNKILVVSDAITKYKADVVSLDDSNDEQPIREYLYNYELENNATDGFNLCTIDYMKRVADSLELDYIPSGVCLRYAWLKGMMFPFPIMEFVERYGSGYIVKDIWGHDVDIREVDLILTESSLKLWKCYDSIEDYISKCSIAGYNFAVTKVSPNVLEDIRTLNYQYLQSYNLSEKDITTLCSPTLEWLQESLAGDYESTLKFLGIDNFSKSDWNKALYLDKQFLNDEYFVNKIKRLIKKKINDAKIGKLLCHGNYQILSGDPIILMQHALGIQETGLLKPKEVYSNYWLKEKVKKVVAFRSPMTSHENIRKVKINQSKEAEYWYRYMPNIFIVNSWDTFCMAENGADNDGDSIYSTNNSVLLTNYRELPALMCVQKTAAKKIITEEEIIKSNWTGLGISVGAITNRVTSQINVMAGFEEESEEWKELELRVQFGQLHQQNSIDSVKGIEAKPMPSHWYTMRNCKNDFDRKICAQYKPYFMIYRYNDTKKAYNEYVKKNRINALKRFGKSLEELLEASETELSNEENIFVKYYNQYFPVDMNPSTMNKICWHIECSMDNYKVELKERKLSYDFLKYNCICHKEVKQRVEELFQFYIDKLNTYRKNSNNRNIDLSKERLAFVQYIREELNQIPKKKEAFDIMIEIANTKKIGKQFIWETYSEAIINRLIEVQNNVNIE